MSSATDKAGKGQSSSEHLDSKVIPVMREAVTLVQVVLFGELKRALANKYDDWSQDDYRCLIGCIVNDIFGTPAQDEESQQFSRKYMEIIEEELRALAGNVPDILSSLTDALRMQTLCDHEEGMNTMPTLLRARALGVLHEERPIPMPSTFMILARQLGVKYGLLEAKQVKVPPSGQQE